MLNKIKDFDFYRKIPKDLTETSTHGAALSICASLFMLVLFVAELWSFLSVQYSTNVVIDYNEDPLLRINFNITVLSVPCEFATIDVVDVLGTRNDNITKNINRWNVDDKGFRRGYDGRNREQRELDHDYHHDNEALHANGVHAIPMSEADFDEYLKNHEYSFINFYAPWCIWCQRLEPVWEAFAEEVFKKEQHEHEWEVVKILKVDCVANRNLCMKQRVQAFPTLRLFKRNEAQVPDYRSDRTVESFMQYLVDHVALQKHLETLSEEDREAHKEMQLEIHSNNPGCMLQGFLLVNRVPGNFHIEARSNFHNLNPVMANLSHIVHQFSMGPVNSFRKEWYLARTPKDVFSIESTHPMNDNAFSTQELHQAYHHYLKVVSTHFSYGADKDELVYQMVASSQVMHYQEGEIPEARFSYDLSPMAVVISKKGKRWYEFVTSVCALIGGTFTVVGLLSGALGIIFKNKKL